MQTVGSRAKVMHGTALKTSGGLRKRDLKYNKSGKIVSKKASASAKRCNNLGLMKGGSIFTRDKKFHKKRSCKSKDKPEGNFWKIYKCLCENDAITVSEGNKLMGVIVDQINNKNIFSKIKDRNSANAKKILNEYIKNSQYQQYLENLDTFALSHLYSNQLSEGNIKKINIMDMQFNPYNLFTKIFKIVKGKTVLKRQTGEKIEDPDTFFGLKNVNEKNMKNICGIMLYNENLKNTITYIINCIINLNCQW